MTVDLDNMRERLEAKLAELHAHLNDLHEEYRSSGSFIETQEKALEFEEAASDLAERQLQQTIIANEVALIAEVHEALQRISQGQYGFCTACGEPIPEKRLEALPWAARCAKDEEQFFQGRSGFTGCGTWEPSRSCSRSRVLILRQHR